MASVDHYTELHVILSVSVTSLMDTDLVLIDNYDSIVLKTLVIVKMVDDNDFLID
jgi:hypothetical protein